MAYTNSEWHSVLLLLIGHGFTVVSEDKAEGLVTVKVPT
jgi:hypothetical protein